MNNIYLWPVTLVSNTWPCFHNREKMVSSEPSNLRNKWVPGEMIFSPWWKSVEIWPSIFFPKCRVSDQRGDRVYVDRCKTGSETLRDIWWRIRKPQDWRQRSLNGVRWRSGSKVAFALPTHSPDVIRDTDSKRFPRIPTVWLRLLSSPFWRVDLFHRITITKCVNSTSHGTWRVYSFYIHNHL
jgi:hypothetical protein